MTIDWSSEEQDEVPSSSESSSESAPADIDIEDTKTAPIAVIPSLPPNPTRPFRIWSPYDPDLTEQMRYDIEVAMTADYWSNKAREEENRVEMPDEFRERRVVWRLIFQEAIVVPVIMLMGWALVGLGLNGWINLVIGIIMTIGVIVGLYLWKFWLITYQVVTADKTGIERHAVRWMFISEIKPELSTSAIIISVPRRNPIFTGFNINWWKVRLETAAEGETPTVKRMHFVRHGDILDLRISQFKRALLR